MKLPHAAAAGLLLIAALAQGAGYRPEFVIVKGGKVDLP